MKATYENSKSEEWANAMKAQGHEPVVDDHGLNFFAYEDGHHNGPACSKCGWSCCWHCLDPKDIPACTE